MVELLLIGAAVGFLFGGFSGAAIGVCTVAGLALVVVILNS